LHAGCLKKPLAGARVTRLFPASTLASSWGARQPRRIERFTQFADVTRWLLRGHFVCASHIDILDDRNGSSIKPFLLSTPNNADKLGGTACEYTTLSKASLPQLISSAIN
jgi:hypothetical protein